MADWMNHECRAGGAAEKKLFLFIADFSSSLNK
jgi:hypothetical protein